MCRNAKELAISSKGVAIWASFAAWAPDASSFTSRTSRGLSTASRREKYAGGESMARVEWCCEAQRSRSN